MQCPTEVAETCPYHAGLHRRPAMTLRRYRPIALVMLALHLQACASWAPSALPPRQLIEAERPTSVRITKTDGTQQVVREPSIQGDSIARTLEDCRISIAAAGRVPCESTTSGVAALADVQAIESWKRDTPKTVGAIVLLMPVVVVGAFMLASTVSCGNYVCG